MTSYNLIGFLPFEDHGIGFAQAIFEDIAGDLYFQIPGTLGVKPNFKRISSEIDFVYTSATVPSAESEFQYIYAFLDRNGVAHAGSARTLKPIFIKYLNDRKCPSSVQLQIADIIGSSSQRRHLNITLRQEIEKAYGSRSARIFYESSVLYDTFWRIVGEAIREESDLSELVKFRRRLSSNLKLSDEILPEADWEELAPLLRFSPSMIRQRVLAEVPPIAPSVIDSRPKSEEPAIAALALQLQSNTRQEERIASLLKSFVISRDVGSQLSSAIKPRSKFEKSAFRYISRIFEVPIYFDAAENDLAAQVVERLYRLRACRRRAYFLLYMAQELGNVEKIGIFIKEALDSSRSREVLDMRKEILSAFDK